jgi:hypothetical protein
MILFYFFKNQASLIELFTNEDYRDVKIYSLVKSINEMTLQCRDADFTISIYITNIPFNPFIIFQTNYSAWIQCPDDSVATAEPNDNISSFESSFALHTDAAEEKDKRCTSEA